MKEQKKRGGAEPHVLWRGSAPTVGGRVLVMEGFINRTAYFRLHQILLDLAHQSPGPIR